jgi:hypothetical protein
LLNVHDPFADRRRGDFKSLGGGIEASRFDDLSKSVDAAQCIHGRAPSRNRGSDGRTQLVSERLARVPIDDGR